MRFHDNTVRQSSHAKMTDESTAQTRTSANEPRLHRRGARGGRGSGARMRGRGVAPPCGGASRAPCDKLA